MEKAMYDSIVRLLRNGTYPPEDFNYRLHIRRCAKNYTLYGRRLCRGSQIVLHEEEAFIALRSFYSRKEHLRGPEFSAAVQKTYNVNRVKVLCFEFVRCCANCSVTHTHHSVRQRKGLCRSIGIPFLRDVGLTDAPELDSLRFRPLTVDLAGPWNCFCVVLSYVLSVTCKNGAAIEQWARKIARGSHSSLYNTFGAHVPESLDDTSYLTSTDIKINALELKINLYGFAIFIS